MGKHSLMDDGVTGPRPEPVAIASAIQAVLAAAVTIGWVQLDDTTLATIATAVAGVVSLVLTLIARSKVTPVSDPRVTELHDYQE